MRYMDGWIAADAIMVHPKGRRAFYDCQKHFGVALMNLLTQASFRCALEFPVHTRFLRVDSKQIIFTIWHRVFTMRTRAVRKTALAREREIASAIDS